jgi:AcrR family transcriptional regulator
MTRAAQSTRQALIDAATAVFADKGYEGGSVRLITQRARANQAAIAYHFRGKEGLYREVLRAALHAFDEFGLIDERGAAGMERDEALRLFLTQQLQPLLKRNQLSRYLRIFNWEILQRSAAFEELVATERIPAVATANAILARYLPESASVEERAVTMMWLLNQAYVFVRNYEYLSKPPFGLKLDQDFVERLIALLTRLLSSGLAGLADHHQPR